MREPHIPKSSRKWREGKVRSVLRNSSPLASRLYRNTDGSHTKNESPGRTQPPPAGARTGTWERNASGGPRSFSSSADNSGRLFLDGVAHLQSLPRHPQTEHALVGDPGKRRNFFALTSVHQYVVNVDRTLIATPTKRGESGGPQQCVHGAKDVIEVHQRRTMSLQESSFRHLTLVLSAAILLSGAAACVLFAARTPEGTRGLSAIRVPPGFKVENAAGPELSSYPMMGTFDNRGRLFIAESSGNTLERRNR